MAQIINDLLTQCYDFQILAEDKILKYLSPLDLAKVRAVLNRKNRFYIDEYMQHGSIFGAENDKDPKTRRKNLEKSIYYKPKDLNIDVENDENAYLYENTTQFKAVLPLTLIQCFELSAQVSPTACKKFVDDYKFLYPKNRTYILDLLYNNKADSKIIHLCHFWADICPLGFAIYLNDQDFFLKYIKYYDPNIKNKFHRNNQMVASCPDLWVKQNSDGTDGPLNRKIKMVWNRPIDGSDQWTSYPSHEVYFRPGEKENLRYFSIPRRNRNDNDEPEIPAPKAERFTFYKKWDWGTLLTLAILFRRTKMAELLVKLGANLDFAMSYIERPVYFRAAEAFGCVAELIPVNSCIYCNLLTFRDKMSHALNDKIVNDVFDKKRAPYLKLETHGYKNGQTDDFFR